MRLNCVIVALWLWLWSRGRAFMWVRRSLHFRGLIPHTGTMHLIRDGLAMIDYVPPEEALWTGRNFVLLFDGTYRVQEMRVVAEHRFKTMADVRQWITAQGVSA